jgi:hypothetical protein
MGVAAGVPVELGIWNFRRVILHSLCSSESQPPALFLSARLILNSIGV